MQQKIAPPKFKVVSALSIETLEERVNSWIKKGWTPTGGVACERIDPAENPQAKLNLGSLYPYTRYLQAIFRPDK